LNLQTSLLCHYPSFSTLTYNSN